MTSNRKQLTVKYKGRDVGTLALAKTGQVAFQYTKDWLKDGFSISPFSLPLSEDVFVHTALNMDGLFGVFYDSLPDAWGKLVVDRTLSKSGMDVKQLNVLDRLAIVGANGMGALEYYPQYNYVSNTNSLTIDQLAEECNNIINSITTDNLDELFKVAGSSGGARPKAFVRIEDEEWLIKFQYSLDKENSGLREFQYSYFARECGISMSETKLFPSNNSSGYFGTKRFDRPKIHMVSAAGLLEADFNNSVCDYKDLLKLTNIITNGNTEEIKEMYTRMCFNVVFHNQDDHLKNFAYLYDEKYDKWHISPAYDLTDAATAFGEHTTTVNGKGKNILDEDLISVGIKSGLGKDFCKEKLMQVKEVYFHKTGKG